MNYREAQKEFAERVKNNGSRVKGYFWRLSGDEGNSLCRFMGIDEMEMKLLLRLCKVYVGEKDNFSKNNFELLMSLCGCDSTTYRPDGKVERFILIGNSEGKVVLPKDQYDAEGVLQYYPVEDEHFKNIRTKSQKGSLPRLLSAAANKQQPNAGPTKEDCKNNRQETLRAIAKATFDVTRGGIAYRCCKNWRSKIIGTISEEVPSAVYSMR
jgi:hypothetical protein